MQRRKGFTLIELLVVIAIIAILAAILFPVFSQARMRARQTACLSNLKQLGTAMTLYKDDWGGHFVSSTTYSGVPTAGAPWGFGSWIFQIMGYVKTMQVFHCPAAANPWVIPYINPPEKCGYGMNEVIYYRHLYDKSHESKIPHPSNTLLISDAYVHTFVHDWNDYGDPHAPANYDGLPSGMVRAKYSDGLYKGELRIRHNGPNVLFVDLHARFVRPGEWKAENYPNTRSQGIPPNRNDAGTRQFPIIWPPAQPYR